MTRIAYIFQTRKLKLSETKSGLKITQIIRFSHSGLDCEPPDGGDSRICLTATSPNPRTTGAPRRCPINRVDE